MVSSKFAKLASAAIFFCGITVQVWSKGAVTPNPAETEAPGTTQLYGKVHALGSPDGVSGATIGIQGWTIYSDSNGFYGLKLSAGTWALRVSAVGFVPLSKTVKISAGKRELLDIGLNPVSFQSEEVTILAHRERPQAIQASINQAEIKEIPGTFGDPVRAVQILPGVGIPNDFSGQLLVQGAGPGDNLYLMDNLPWPIPFHFGALVSTVSPELLDKVDLYEAGYGARWGGSLACVLDAKTVAPHADRLHAEADISILMSSVVVDGPLGVGDATFAVTGRRSYIDVIGGLVKISPLPVFWDSQAVLNFSLGPHDHFHALAMASDDAYDVTLNAKADGGFSGTVHDNQDFQSGGVSWTNSSLSNFVSTLTPYVYHTDSILTFDAVGTKIYRTTYGVKEDGVWTAGKWFGLGHEVGVGGNLELSDYTFEGYYPRVVPSGTSFTDLTSLVSTLSTVRAQGLNSYAYLLDRIQWNDRWALTLGMHYDTSSLVSQGSLGPRASLEWRIDPKDKWTAVWGLYDQPPVAVDVNPQYGNPGLQPEDAEHIAMSFERTFGGGLSGKADAYYKTLEKMVVLDPANPNLYDNGGIGDSKGLDFYLKEDLGERFFGWISYSLSKSERLNLPNEAWGLYEYDQPDIVNLIASYSPTARWTVGERLRYNSGNLVQPAGSNYYSQRLPHYFCLDLRVDRTWLFQEWTLKAYVELYNALNRKNIAQEVTNSQGQTDSIPDFPRLPVIGVEAKY